MSSTSSVNKRNHHPNQKHKLHIDLTYSPSSLGILNPNIRARSPSFSRTSNRGEREGESSELLPTPDSDSFALPSPSNPFIYEFLPSPPPKSPITSGTRRKRWIRKMIKRNFHPTPLGYAILMILLISLLYTFSGSGDQNGMILRRPSTTTSLSNGNEDTYIQEEEDEEENDEILYEKPVLEELPSIYSEYIPSLILPNIFDNPTYHLLSSKLDQFLHRPIQSHDEAKEDNYEGCPRELSDKLVNPDQYNGDAQFWIETVTAQEIASRRAGLIRWLEDKLNKGEEIIGRKDGRTGEGRGIVLTGGNQDTTLRTITAIKHLRRLGVDLPIEVFHYSDELTDRGQRDEIEALGASLREAKGLEKVSGVWKNWQIKGLALVQSSFREILYLDSDNVPLRSPVHLFDSPIYKSNGRAVFWPDLSKDHPDNAIWRLVGDTCSLDLWTFESGQIVIDKAGNSGLNLVALIIASEMMNEREFWFHMCGGDKDTFRWAFRILDIPFGVSPRWMSALGVKNGYEGGRFCGHSVLQHDLDTPEGFTRPPPLFVHSNLLKHLGSSGLGKGNLFTHIRRMSNDYASNPSLNYAHSWVYMGQARGMCLDLDWHDHTPQEIRDVEWPETISVVEEEGGVFDGFEDIWFEEGGRIGGW
ncbi:uncharacterized protein L199_008660 [Kwoniella botswanensis]|uniref:uncharacterized protein n=1 Tax=Kwoniella botswanensis TaxID=1268659 RepID=UPI00315CE4BE